MKKGRNPEAFTKTLVTNRESLATDTTRIIDRSITGNIKRLGQVVSEDDGEAGESSYLEGGGSLKLASGKISDTSLLWVSV